MPPKTLLLTAGVALAVVVAHEKFRAGQSSMPKVVR
jgi:hypothetical protein